MKNTLIVLLGPTGVGKTAFAIDLAVRYGSEIVSADSRQFYREMCIGTAVPTDEQLSLVRHHFIRFIPADRYYSSSLFERDVLSLLPGLFEKNNIVIMAGGSGMYVDAVCQGIDEIPDVDTAIREKYNRLYAETGTEGLRMALKILDPGHYTNVDLKNHKRIIRALEICESTGRPYSSFLKKEKRQRDFVIIRIGLTMDRKELFHRIDHRVDEMMKAGLEEEARNLYHLKHLNALNTVGYRELFEYFDGNKSLEEAVSLIKRNTRRYAKRQITWWQKDQSVKWFNPEDREGVLRYVEERLSVER
jgi:tRNA dimethylallyltransferase